MVRSIGFDTALRSMAGRFGIWGSGEGLPCRAYWKTDISLKKQWPTILESDFLVLVASKEPLNTKP